MISTALDYSDEIKKELFENILSYWMKYSVDNENGGFFGYINVENQIEKKADKGCILNSRILWTFSAAYNSTGNKEYLRIAGHAYDFLKNCFWDREYSGLYWMVDYSGRPINTRKQVYNIAFGIYGLAEYYAACGDEESLEKAKLLFEAIETYAYDSVNKGYFEGLSRQWQQIDDLRLSEKDLNEKKSMNTHLHILEAYTNLYRYWKDKRLRIKLRELIEVSVEKIIDPDTYHFRLFFDECWNSRSGAVSYGHDIEGSWLLYEAAEVLGDGKVLEKVRNISVKMAQVVYEEAIDHEIGGLINEMDAVGHKDPYRAWWPQAEAMVGFLNAYELTEHESYFNASYEMWKYAEKYIIDKEKGEWYWRVSLDGKPDKSQPKVEPWKCPYHNGRACLEIIKRLDKYITK